VVIVNTAMQKLVGKPTEYLGKNTDARRIYK
jgi:hypothetical protein